MKGQLSFESLVLFAIFLSLLAASYFASSRIASAAQAKTSLALSESSFREFAQQLDSACSMGNGNVRLVKIRGNNATISSINGELEFSSGIFKKSHATPCAVSLQNGQPSSSFRLENKEGTIHIS